MTKPTVTIRETHLNHPERANDEVFITNSAGLRTDYKTVRYGDVAYDIYGNPVNGLKPVFVKMHEYVTTQMDYAKRRI